MNEALAQALVALELSVRLSLPVCAGAFGVALVVALLQMWSRLSEPTLNALPRAFSTLLLLGGLGSWMAVELLAYTHELFRALPQLVR